MMVCGYVYALVDPRSMEIVYVGETSKSIFSRLGTHIQGAFEQGKYAKDLWIRELIIQGLLPQIITLETVYGIGDSKTDKRTRYYAEKFWKNRLQHFGSKLFNSDLSVISSQNLRKAWKTKTKEQRSATMRELRLKYLASLTPEQRSEMTRKGHETRRRKRSV